MKEFVASASRWRIALLVLASLAFIAIGVWLIGTFGEVPVSTRHSATENNFIGSACIILGVIGAVSMIPELLTGGEILRVGPTGVHYRRWSKQFIPWSQIKEVTTWSYKRQSVIALHLIEPGTFPGRLIPGLFAKANRWLSGGDIQISLVGTDQSLDEALSAIEHFRPADPLGV